MKWKCALYEEREGSYTTVIGVTKNHAEGYIFPKEERGHNK